MHKVISLAVAATLVSVVSNASADPTCVTPCVTETPTKMRSIPVFATGVFFDVVGAAALAAGTGVVVASHDCGPQVACSVDATVVDVVGIAAMAGGAILLAIGIPLTVVGGKSVPDIRAKTGRGDPLMWTF